VRLSGKELGEGLDRRQLREEAREYARKNFAGQKVTVLSNGAEVLISMGGIRHTLTYAKTRAEMQAVVATPQLLQRAVKVGEEPDEDKRPYVKAIEKYHTGVEVAGTQYIAEMTVTVVDGRPRLLDDIRIFYNQNLKGPNE